MRQYRLHSLLLWTYLLVAPLSLMAQNYKEDMEKIHEGYTSKYHSFKMTWMYFPDSLSYPTDSMTGNCFVNGASYYYNIKNGSSHYEYLKNEKYYLVIDHSNKVVAVSKSANVKMQSWSLDKVDSLLNNPSVKVSYKLIANGKGEYNVALQGEAWSRVKIIFNKTNFTIEEITMFSSAAGKIYGEKYNKPRVKISYSDYNEKLPDEKIFSETNYLNESSGKTLLAAGYKNYKLLDYAASAKKSHKLQKE
jgi:hypothetical protein